MKLLEFITYCTIKGYVQEHVLESRWAKEDRFLEKRYSLVIEGRGYSAIIKYSTCNGEVTIQHRSIVDHASEYMLETYPTLDVLVETFMPGDQK